MKKTFIISAILLFFLLSCLSHRNKILIVNYSNEGQIVYCTCSDSIGSQVDSLAMADFKQFDDFKPEIFIERGYQYVDKKSSNWVYIFDREDRLALCCQDSLVRFFFITDTVFLNHPWDTIATYQMYNRKLVFSQEDLKKVRWVIEYKKEGLLDVRSDIFKR